MRSEVNLSSLHVGINVTQNSGVASSRAFVPAYFNVNAPPALLPLLVNGTNGGLSACT